MTYMLDGSSQVLGMPTYEQKSVSEDRNYFPSSAGVIPGLFKAYFRAGLASCRIIVLNPLDEDVE
jgi:hypothetical protein